MNFENLQKAWNKLNYFKKLSVSPLHQRYLFPYFSGTYFTYRKIDVTRITKMAYSISDTPMFLDVGCGYGDFLDKIRQYIPNSEGIERDYTLFWYFGIIKPEHIIIGDVRWDLSKQYDMIFVGWMEPGIDFRRYIKDKTNVIITTLDQGISLSAEYEDLGFDLIASWRTPSWEDISTEITNKYYSNITKDQYFFLNSLRSAHNLWYVYVKQSSELCNVIRESLINSITEEENERVLPTFDFECVLNDCGFGHFERIFNPVLNIDQRLWKIDLY